ncbi:hypothetical protein [Amycolatopsis sp. NPDC051128]|uniref:hypothetical protein n=1 Tax=Amycolatopsis sp. NPDC051128 TaxID=3155412 RepID=UPI00343A219E
MTRSARRRRDRVTVDELLRQTGVQPRQVGSRSSPAARASRSAAAGVPSDRRAPAPDAAGPGGRLALASGVAVVLGGLVLVLTAQPDSIQQTTPFPQLQPATGVPSPTSALAVPTETSTPSPVVMQARRTPTPTPTVTVKLPPPVTTTPKSTPPPPPTWGPPMNPYQCYPYCGGYGYPYGR